MPSRPGSSPTIRHPFGAAVTVTGGPGGVTNRFRIVFEDVDDAICAALGDAFAGRSRARAGLVEMTVNGTALASPVTNAQVAGTVEAVGEIAAAAGRIQGQVTSGELTVTGAMRAQTVEAAGLVEAGSTPGR